MNVNKQGYIEIYKPGHPNARAKGSMFEHRFVMSKFLGRPLKINEIVHHKNHNTRDNRIENLEIMIRGDHSKHHNKGKIGLRGKSNPRFMRVKTNCNFCGKEIFVFKYTVKKYKKRFCDPQCHGKYKSGKKSGRSIY